MGLFDRDPTRALRTRASALLREDKFAEALPICQRVVDMAPRLATGWSNLGWALLALDRYEEALAACDTALFLDEQHIWAWNNKGATLMRAGKHEEALAAIERAIELEPTALKPHYNRLRTLLALKRFDETVASATKLLRAVPSHAGMWVTKAQALKVAPDDRFALSEAAVFYVERLKDPDQALQICNHLVSLRPTAAALQLQADVLRLCGQPTEARLTYEQAIAHGAAQGRWVEVLWLNYGLTLVHVGQFRSALEMYDKVEAITPGRAAVMVNRGIIFSRVERHEQALDFYEAAVEAGSVSPLSLANLALEYLAFGRYAAAEVLIEKASAVNNERDGCRWHAKGALALAHGNFEEAYQHMLTSTRIQAFHAHHHAGLAEALQALERPAEALQAIEQAITLSPFDARWWRTKAQALRALGKLDEAAEAEQRGASLLAEQTAQVDAYLAAKGG